LVENEKEMRDFRCRIEESEQMSRQALEHKTVDFNMVDNLIGKHKMDMLNQLNMFGEDFDG
jgi:hypothetical protein